MGGSYSHCRDEKGNFTMDLLDNMGDAREALEEMFYMINFLAEINFTNEKEDLIKAAHDAYIEKTVTSKMKPIFNKQQE